MRRRTTSSRTSVATKRTSSPNSAAVEIHPPRRCRRPRSTRRRRKHGRLPLTIIVAAPVTIAVLLSMPPHGRTDLTPPRRAVGLAPMAPSTDRAPAIDIGLLPQAPNRCGASPTSRVTRVRRRMGRRLSVGISRRLSRLAFAATRTTNLRLATGVTNPISAPGSSRQPCRDAGGRAAYDPRNRGRRKCGVQHRPATCDHRSARAGDRASSRPTQWARSSSKVAR